MRRYVVLSVNENPEYIFYLPLVTWAWKLFGWNPIIMRAASLPHYDKFFDSGKFMELGSRFSSGMGNIIYVNVAGYRSETVAQVSRLYAATEVERNSTLITSDADMLPLTGQYFRPLMPSGPIVYGHDLTGFGHYPICYISMTRDQWMEVMLINSNDYNTLIKRDLDNLHQARSEDPVKRWVTDQDLITMRLKPFNKTIINRGVLPNGYAYGRVDRSAWTLDHPELIDCHMLRDIYKNPDHLAKTMLLLYKVWPEEDFTWFTDYVKEFSKLFAE